MPGNELASLLPKTTKSPAETFALGREIATHLTGSEIVGLYGQLGAGKTLLIKGICDAFGISPEDVHSPTFTIVNEYQAPGLTVYHFDAYRVERLAEFYDLGYEDYFYGNAVSLVEWADRVEPLLPNEAIRIHLEHAGLTQRHITLLPGPR